MELLKKLPTKKWTRIVWSHPASHWGMALFVVPLAIVLFFQSATARDWQ